MVGRGPLAWALLVAVLAVTAGVSVAAYRLAEYSWAQVVDYRSPYVTLPKPAVGGETTSGPAVADRVVLVVVDGLREDVSRGMRGLGTLRAHGADLVLTVPQPSVSYPNWTTIFSGAPPSISGVTTNWHEGRAAPDQLFAQAFAANRRVVVVGPTDFETLYAVRSGARAALLRDWPKDGEYLTGRLVDDALKATREVGPSLVVVLLPDIDEAGHRHGGASEEYRKVVMRVDADVQRLVEGLQDGKTAFAVVADHGHTDTGGHGGWEPSVVRVPGVFAGAGVRLSRGEGRLEDVAPTVAALAGLPAPRQAVGEVLRSVVATSASTVFDPPAARRRAFAEAYAETVTGRRGSGMAVPVASGDPTLLTMERADAERLSRERAERLPLAAGLATAALLVVVLVGLASWRALVAALAGTAAYYVVYDGLFFVVHRLDWSLSAINAEELLQAFFNARMAEAVLGGVVGCVVAGIAYAMLRERPKGPRQGYAAGWLALGPVTVLVVQATLAVQVAWFLWAWGARVVWTLPDLRWGFKYDLDLVQTTALGAAALLGCVATYLVGRYHPRTARSA